MESMVKDEFFYACQKGYLSMVCEALQEDPTLVCQQDACGRTALHYACGSGHAAVAKYLIQKGAHVNAKDRRGETSVQLAHRSHVYPLVSILERNAVNKPFSNADGAEPYETTVHP